MQRLGQRQRVARRHQHAVGAVLDHAAVARDVRGDDRRPGGEGLGQHHPERLAAERRRAQHVRARQRGALLLVVDAPERAHAARVGQQRGQRVRVDADHRQPRGDVLAQRLEGAQQHRQALALDGLADERDLQRVARAAPPRRGRPAGGQRDAVGHDPVLAAEEAPPGPLRGLGHRDPHAQAVHVAARAPQPRDRVREQVVRVGVVGGDDRREGERGRHPAGQRRDRLVQVDDVVVARPQLPPQRRGRERRVGDVRLRAVERPAQRRAERDEVIRRRCRAHRRRARSPAAHGLRRSARRPAPRCGGSLHRGDSTNRERRARSASLTRVEIRPAPSVATTPAWSDGHSPERRSAGVWPTRNASVATTGPRVRIRSMRARSASAGSSSRSRWQHVKPVVDRPGSRASRRRRSRRPAARRRSGCRGAS